MDATQYLLLGLFVGLAFVAVSFERAHALWKVLMVPFLWYDHHMLGAKDDASNSRLSLSQRRSARLKFRLMFGFAVVLFVVPLVLFLAIGRIGHFLQLFVHLWRDA